MQVKAAAKWNITTLEGERKVNEDAIRSTVEVSLTSEAWSRFRIGLVLVFGLAGSFFLASALTSQGTGLLVGPGIASLASCLLIGFKARGWYVRALVVSSGLYSFIIFSYQSLSALSLIDLGLTLFGGVAFVGYLLGALATILAAVAAYAKAEPFGRPPVQAAEESKRRRS